jgi:phospholipid/cholesterol/gamma-HCH transport system substrate-binding protein
MNKKSGSTWKLGMFVLIGLVAFTSTIYFVGKQKIFGSTFTLNSHFKNVSGLEVGNVLFRNKCWYCKRNSVGDRYFSSR